MKRFLMALAALACLQAPVAVQAQTQWKLASGYSDDTFHTVNLREFAKDVATATNGQLQIAVHSHAKLIALNDIAPEVQKGEKIDMAEIFMSLMAKEVPLTSADNIPFLARTVKDATALWQEQRKLLAPVLEARNMRLLYAVPWSSTGFFCNHPIHSKEDLKGRRLRTYNPATVRLAEVFGAISVDLKNHEMEKALIDNKVDCLLTSAPTALQNNAWKYLKYFYDVHAWFPKNMVVVNSKKFKELPPAQQKALEEAALRAEKRGWEMMASYTDAAVKTLRDKGMTVSGFTVVTERSLDRTSEIFSQEWMRTVNKDGIQLMTNYALAR